MYLGENSGNTEERGRKEGRREGEKHRWDEGVVEAEGGRRCSKKVKLLYEEM